MSNVAVGSNTAVGIGIVTRSLLSSSQPVLDVRYLALQLGGWSGENLGAAFSEPGEHALGGPDLLAAAQLANFAQLPALLGEDAPRGVKTSAVSVVVADLQAAPQSATEVYLRLHLLSHRLVVPHGQNLDGVFALLHNVVWTNHGPADTDGFEATRLRMIVAHGPTVQVFGVDKFPRMVDYVIPSGVRIADADRVRLGAYLAEGTTVMHEGFINFNAGTLGPSMVEGRISAGVVVGAGSDLGGSASIMGTLSGGGTEVIRVGERCLIGANAGIGISLGDDCLVEAGLYVTGGTLVALPDGTVVKGRELSGRSNLLYRRNSQSGAVEARPRDGSRWEGLNTALHAHN